MMCPSSHSDANVKSMGRVCKVASALRPSTTCTGIPPVYSYVNAVSRQHLCNRSQTSSEIVVIRLRDPKLESKMSGSRHMLSASIR